MKTRLYMSDGTSRDIDVMDGAPMYVWREWQPVNAPWLPVRRCVERTAMCFHLFYPDDFIGPMMGHWQRYTRTAYPRDGIICTIFVQDYAAFKAKYRA